MRRVTVTVDPAPDGWSVAVAVAGTEPRPSRQLPRVGDFPAPAPESPLARGEDSVQDALDRLMLRAPEGDDVANFGRYLFDTLLGPDWDRIVDAAGAEDIELALSWEDSQSALSRLPWELMHGPDEFLVGDRHRSIAITRLVKGADNVLEELPASLHVLFVIGTDRHEQAIRPGREYLALVQRLQAQGIGFCSRVLTQANRETLKDALRRWKPSVVHFISHGRFEGGEAKLSLTAEDGSGSTDLVDATELINLFTTAGRLPQIVVLSACHTSGVPVGHQAAPMAARLVAKGIPMVVGMSGQVADSACRLFTRRFYEALLQGESVVAATAEGRRAGLTGADPYHTVDWAFPSLLLAEGACADVRIEETNRDLVARLHLVADDLREDRNPPVFCDRFEVVEDAYHRLMATDLPTGKRVLGVRVTPGPSGGDTAKYGKTRLLRELAAQAAAEGNVPCLLTFGRGDDTPSSLGGLAMAIVWAMLATRDAFSARGFALTKMPTLETLDVLVTCLGDALAPPRQFANRESAYSDRLEQVSSALAVAGQHDGVSRKVLAPALRADLHALGEEARQFIPEATVLVLFDEVHSYDAAAGELLDLLDANGLGMTGDPVPVVLAFSTVADTKYSTATRRLRDFIESNQTHVDRLELGPFRSPLEDPVPYEQFLLHGTKRSLVISRRATPEKVRMFFSVLEKYTDGGVPSKLRLPSPGVEATLDMAMADCLELADDEDKLVALRNR